MRRVVATATLIGTLLLAAPAAPPDASPEMHAEAVTAELAEPSPLTGPEAAPALRAAETRSPLEEPQVARTPIPAAPVTDPTLVERATSLLESRWWASTDGKILLTLCSLVLLMLLMLLLHSSQRRQFEDALAEIEERLREDLGHELQRRLAEATAELRREQEERERALREEIASRDRAQGQALAAAASDLRAHVDERHRDATKQVERVAERLLAELHESERAQSEALRRAIGDLRRELEEQRRRTEAEFAALREEMEQERALIAAQFEQHRAEREDRRNQRRIDAVVDRYADPDVARRAEECADPGVREFARLREAGLRDLRSDIECIHAIGRILDRGGLQGIEHADLRRLVRVGVKRFFETLAQPDGRPLTAADVEAHLAHLEAERHRDLLEEITPGRPRQITEGVKTGSA